MFVRALGDYQARGWKVEDWWKPPAQPTSIIPGVSNTTTAVAGSALGLAAAAALAWWLWKK